MTRVRILCIFVLFFLNVLGAARPIEKPPVEPPAVHIKRECVRSSTLCREGAFGKDQIGDTTLCPTCVTSCLGCEQYLNSRWWCRWFGNECKSASQYHGVPSTT